MQVQNTQVKTRRFKTSNLLESISGHLLVQGNVLSSDCDALGSGIVVDLDTMLGDARLP